MGAGEMCFSLIMPIFCKGLTFSCVLSVPLETIIHMVNSFDIGTLLHWLDFPLILKL